ncbi:hypothetical protein N9X81_02820 [Schleiferiaceae bacterium]|nr:hypothetical protein [Schleiferiaceae bacterium]MDC3183501.1 hypothetical protein [Schleiferiaceae bacterium]
MKKLLLTLSLILSIGLFGQSQDLDYSIIVVDTDIMQVEGLKYIELLGTSKLNGDILISVDYGQETKLFGKAQTIRDESKGSFQNGTAKNMTFNSMIDALNWFDARGWNYVNQYAITIGNSNVYHILLEKE